MIFNTEKFKLAYQIEGNRESTRTLVFLSGIFHGQASWLKQTRFRYFKQNYRMVFVDYPGCGDSAVGIVQPFEYQDILQSLMELINELGSDDITLVGYSLGGIIGMDLVHQQPQKFKRMILINSAHEISHKGRMMTQNVGQMLQQGVSSELIFANVYPWFFSEPYLRQLEDLHATVLQRYCEYNHNRQTLLYFLQAIRKRDHHKSLTELPIPSLMIGCSEDTICTFEQQQILFDANPNMQWALLEQRTHVANVENHQQVNKLIQTFLALQLKEKADE